MGGRMVTLRESRASVEVHRQDADDARRSKRVRERQAFRVNDFVMVGRRAGQVRGLLGGEIYVVKFTDNEERAQVAGSEMVRRFTTQTVGFVPKGAEREAVVPDAGEVES